MGKKTKVTLLAIFVVAIIGCDQKPYTPPPSPSISITTWDNDYGPGAKITYHNHPTPRVGNAGVGPPEVVFTDPDHIQAYAVQMQRVVDDLGKIEDRMRQMEGQDVPETEQITQP
jgi:hypothetical protein